MNSRSVKRVLRLFDGAGRSKSRWCREMVVARWRFGAMLATQRWCHDVPERVTRHVRTASAEWASKPQKGTTLTCPRVSLVARIRRASNGFQNQDLWPLTRWAFIATPVYRCALVVTTARSIKGTHRGPGVETRRSPYSRDKLPSRSYFGTAFGCKVRPRKPNGWFPSRGTIRTLISPHHQMKPTEHAFDRASN